ncbi:MAG TPA: S46 family peptidase, partial [Bacteroidia bacterium]|nr:S46 family peptidase [Bacteroidia bacterium]
MLKKILITLILTFTVSLALRAAEGMWIPALLKALNEKDMKAMGLKLSAEDIYSVNKSSLKDAIVLFGGGCTAEVVSTQGLILTNHHCGFSQIQSHSSVDHDYLTDGFWAKSKDQELANPGLTATFIVRIEDVTAKILEGTEGLDPAARAGRIGSNIQSIEAATEKAEPKHQAEVRPFFYGNEFYMIVTKTFTDVRLVGAPPGGVGKFGGDTDNWMWPRHTGDFSMFRIYADANNEPAAYSADNKPYSPAHSLPISLKGTKPGDFTMVYGFPGQTQQYLHSEMVNFIAQEMNPRAIAMRDKSLAIVGETMAKSDRLRIAYAAKQARIANAWKKWIGETKGLERLHAIEKKQELERKFSDAVAKDPNLAVQYSNVLSDLQALILNGKPYLMARSLYIEFYFMGPEALRFAAAFSNLADNYDKLVTDGKLADEIKKLKEITTGFYKNYDPDADRRILADLYPMYIDGLNPNLRPDIHATLAAKYGNDWTRYANEAFAKSVFTDEARLNAFLDKFGKKGPKAIQNDPIYLLQKSVSNAWTAKALAGGQDMSAKMQDLMRVYVKGLMTIFNDKKYWPDANSTLRVAYGKVEGSEPADGVIYRPFTTMDGVLAKYVKDDPEFDIPQRLIDIAKARDYGQYADANGDLVVCFTASNQTTGGNSGSPAIDGSGNLIGLNFDRSWES